MKKNFQTLHQRALISANHFRQAEHDLIEILQEIESKRIFRALGFASLFEYAVKSLKLSEANSSNFITVARKAREIPELKKEIQSGNITVSKVRKITPVINKENKRLWIEKAKVLSKSNLEKEVVGSSQK